MTGIERITINLPSDIAVLLKEAIEDGDYSSPSEIVRTALHDWKIKRSIQLQELIALKLDIDKGLSDLTSGRVKDFNAENIIERGKILLASQSNSV